MFACVSLLLAYKYIEEETYIGTSKDLYKK